MLNYGKGPRLLAQELKLAEKVKEENKKWDIDRCKREAIKMASGIIRKYFDQMPKVEEFIEKTHRRVADTKYVESILGRRRYLRHVMDWDEQIEHDRMAKEDGQNACWCQMCAESRGGDRQAVNTIIQASAADITQCSMVIMYEDERLYDCPMLFQVHDEVMNESPIDYVEECIKAVKEDMELPMAEYFNLRVPLKCSPGKGDNWVEAK